ncbi:hypothetical protein [Arthrobacter sp.]|uniref:hypothetical protein n=1 Tax=Arthrobacter sp. TaxID=1667 RepID=UPI002811E456|nr:hypothetical protein [Arthrobacter sp.]
MTKDTTQPDNTTPENIEAHTETAQPPAGGTEGENPALDDTGRSKAAPGEAAKGKDADDMELTPLGLSDEPAKEEDPESFAKPENS